MKGKASLIKPVLYTIPANYCFKNFNQFLDVIQDNLVYPRASISNVFEDANEEEEGMKIFFKMITKYQD